jgi:hypothetical protein
LKPTSAALAASFVLAAGLVAWKPQYILDHVLDLRYGKSLPKPAYPAPANRAEANLQDLDYLSRLPIVDLSFSLAEERNFHAAIERLRKRSATLTPVQFFMGIAEAVATSGNAHTNVDLGAWREQLNSAPVRLAWFAEGLFVVRAMAPHAELLGARVIEIAGRDPVRLAAEAGRFIGGTPERVRATSPLLLESPQALHEIHPDTPGDRLQLRLQAGDGTIRGVELPAVEAGSAPRAARPGRLISAASLALEKAGEWMTLLRPGGEIPPSLRDPGKLTYATRLGARDVLYLHLWRVSTGFEPDVGDAIVAASGREGDPPWKRIILDLRFNDGGEYPTIYTAIKALPRRLAPDGRIMILTDNTTFSGAIITAALARHFGGARATIVGERQGDRLAFWAEGNDIELPNSRLKVHTATGYHDWANGCREMRCYWPNFYYDVAVGHIDPDVRLGWSFADYRRGIDTVLERALQ